MTRSQRSQIGTVPSNKGYLDSSVKGDFQSVEVRSWDQVLCGMSVARDEGLPFVAYRQGAASRTPGQGCAKRTAEGGLALTRP